VGVVTPDQRNRTSTGRPPKVSGPSKVPVSPENEPVTGGSTGCGTSPSPARPPSPRRPGFDAVSYVSRSLARTPWPWQVEVHLDAPLGQVAQQLPATLAELTPDGGGTLLRMRVTSLDWMASVLAGLECRFTIHQPEELRASVAALAERLTRSVRR
jgi:hypothetical protein